MSNTSDNGEFRKIFDDYTSGARKKYISYNGEALEVYLPRGIDFIKAPKAKKIASGNAEREIISALTDNSIGKSLADIVDGFGSRAKEQNVVIVTSDDTRDVNYRAEDPRGLLKPTLDLLLEKGISKDNITILVGTGNHVIPNQEAVSRWIFGNTIVDSFGRGIVYHHSIDSAMTSVGALSNGVDARFNSYVTNANLVVVTGFIEPHFMAGFSGGAKGIFPGVAAAETTLKGIHDAEKMASPSSDFFLIDGNPVRRSINEGLDLIAKKGVQFYLLNMGKHEEELTFVVGGDIKNAFNKGVRRAMPYSNVDVSRKYDIVLFSAGHVTGSDHYQLVKGMCAASRITENDGTVVLLGPNRDGMGGGKGYLSALGQLKQMGPEAYLNYVRGNGSDYPIGAW